MLLEPRRLAGVALRGRAAGRCRTRWSSTRAARRTGWRSSSPPTRTATVCEADRRSCASCAPGWPTPSHGLGLRAAVAGTHPMVRAEDVQVSPGARYQYLHSSLRELARREPTFALHVHVAVPGPGAGRARLQRHARAHPGAARAGRQLAVHPRAGLRPGQRPHARLPGVPAHRHPARVRHLRRLRRGRRRADPLRRDPRADVHLVGRAPAAQARHARGARDGRADAHPRHRRAGRARPVPGADRGAAGHGRAGAHPRPRGARREPLPGRPRRHPRAAAGPAARPLRARLGAAGDARGRLLAARAGAGLRARAGAARPPRRRPGRGPPAGDRVRAARASAASSAPLQGEFSPPRPQLAAAA